MPSSGSHTSFRDQVSHESKWQASLETSGPSDLVIGDFPTEDTPISKGRSGGEPRSRERSGGSLKPQTFEPEKAILRSVDKLQQARKTRMSSWKQILGQGNESPAGGSEGDESGGELQGTDNGPSSSSLLQSDLPSAGSINHAAGTCSPCSFFRRGTCLYGQNCMYCHCEHEKQRRQGKKMRAAQKRRQAQLKGLSQEGSSRDDGSDGELATEEEDAKLNDYDGAFRQANGRMPTTLSL